MNKIQKFLNTTLTKLGVINNFYEGAEVSPSRDLSTDPLTPSENDREARDRIQLMREARYLLKNFSIVKYTEKQFRRNCTTTGFRSHTGDEEMNKRVNDYIEQQMEAEFFDYAQEHDAPTVWGTSLVDAGIDGDVFHYMVKPRGEEQFYIQTIKADMIGSTRDPHNKPYIPGKDLQKEGSISGVVLNSRGGRQYYEKYKPENGRNNSSSSYVFEKRLKAKATLHLYDPSSTDSLRGVTHWETAINDIKDIKMIFGFEKDSVKHAASNAGVVMTETGRPLEGQAVRKKLNLDPSKTPEIHSAEAPTIQEVGGSSLTYLKVGEKFQQFKSERPSASFMDFAEHLYRSGTISVGLPYGIAIDSSKLNGGALRFELSKAESAFKEKRALVEKRLMNPWVKQKLMEAAKLGLISGLNETNVMSIKWTWNYPQSVTADEKYSSKVIIDMVNAGFISKTDAAALQGTTFDEVLEEKFNETMKVIEKAKELQKSSDEDLPLGAFMELLGATSANPNGLSTYSAQKDMSQMQVDSE